MYAYDMNGNCPKFITNKTFTEKSLKAQSHVADKESQRFGDETSVYQTCCDDGPEARVDRFSTRSMRDVIYHENRQNRSCR